MRSTARPLASRAAAFVAAGALALSLAYGPLPAPAAAAGSFTARALDYVHSCQHSDGGFGEKGSASSDPLTAWTMVAIAAAGEDCDAWTVNGKSPAAYLATQASAWRTTTDYARTVLAVVAARKDPRAFGGVDLVGKLEADVHDQGSAGDQLGPYVNSHIWAMIALKAAGRTVTDRETQWLLSEQNSDGGWGWAPSTGSDTNDTAAAVEALVGRRPVPRVGSP